MCLLKSCREIAHWVQGLMEKRALHCGRSILPKGQPGQGNGRDKRREEGMGWGNGVVCSDAK